MPKCWADRAIMFSVIGLVVWAIIGLPALRAFSAYQPAYAQSTEPPANSAKAEEPWLTKDAAGFFTFLLVIVGGFQVALFLWQLWLIRESLDDAKLAADAAKESADATRAQSEISKQTLQTMQETAVRQLRAYLSVYPAMLDRIHVDFEPIFNFAETNNGLTPAYAVEHRGVIDLLEHPLRQNFPFPDLPTTEAGSRITLYPSANTLPTPRMNIVAKRKFSQAEWVEIFEGKKRRLYVFGRIVYKDCFQNDRWTKFCFYFPGYSKGIPFAQQGNWTVLTKLARTPGTFSFVSAGQHNETEEG